MLDNPPSTQKIYTSTLLTLGIYFLYWCSASRSAIARAARRELLPSSWLLAIPGLNYLWIWQYAGALEFVSYRRIKRSDTFLLFVLATFLPYTILSSLPQGYSSYAPQLHEFLILAGIMLAVAVIGYILGLAFFCDVMQRKINKLRVQSPPMPHA
jgi:hypothetical protein